MFPDFGHPKYNIGHPDRTPLRSFSFAWLSGLFYQEHPNNIGKSQSRQGKGNGRDSEGQVSPQNKMIASEERKRPSDVLGFRILCNHFFP